MSLRWRSFHRLLSLPIPIKVNVVVAIFVLIIVALISIGYAGMEVLSGVRAYVGGAGLWSKSQKHALYSLTKYARSRDEAEIFFSRAEGVATRFEHGRTFEGSLQGTETVLVVEDHEQVRLVARDILRRHGYTVLEAETGAEALAILQQRASAIDLLVTDVAMPGMTGLDLVRQLASSHPRLKVLYMSGYAEDTSDAQGLGAVFVDKPFSPEVFARKVREVLNAPPSSPGAR